MIQFQPILLFLRRKILLILLLIPLLFISCSREYDYRNTQTKKVNRQYKTKNVILVVVDGLRYTEGWGDSTHQYIPRMAGIVLKEGVINTQFYNRGDTYTSAGHTSLTTGIYQTIDNGGQEVPDNPSLFQFWNQVSGNDQKKSWIIASKDKLAVLGDCKNRYWSGQYTPMVNAGIDGRGTGSGYREDSLTLKTAIEILKVHQPNLVLINFRDPDYSAHSGVWTSYVDGIRKTDEYVFRLWQFIQGDLYYRNTTTLFVTSDHGRHLDSVADGFVSHGDGCEGCRHISFFVLGPDLKKGLLVNVNREQIDVPVTIAELLGFEFPNSQGNIMFELFQRK